MKLRTVRFFDKNRQPFGDRAYPATPVHVPSDFLGMCFVGYPDSGASPSGLLSYKNSRMSQMVETRWSTIETSPGVYSAAALSTLDAMITFNRQSGASVYFGMYGTPTFYASTLANPTYGDSVTKGPWNGIGECANPTSLTAVTNFVTMLIARYNKPGGAWYDLYGATLGKGIQYWETWNEPTLQAGNGNTGGVNASGSGFWWGTAAQLVDFAQTQFAAIKTLDPSVVVTSPGFADPPSNSPSIFLSTTGPVTGKTGYQSCEAYAWHPYNHNPPGVFYGNWHEDIISGSQGVSTVTNWLTQHGYNLPVWISEWGVDYGNNTVDQQNWYAAAASFRYNWMSRFLMTCAAYGVKSVHPWHWQEVNPTYGNSGNWQMDTLGVQKAYNDLALHMVGKTITNAQFYMNGAASLTFSDGTSWTV